MAEESTPHTKNTVGPETEAEQDAAEMTEEARNAAEGKAPNLAGGSVPSTAEAEVPGTSDPEATKLPTQDTPDPEVANPDIDPNAAEAKQSGAAAPAEETAQPAEAKEPEPADQPDSEDTAAAEAKPKAAKADEAKSEAKQKPSKDAKQAKADDATELSADKKQGKPAAKADEKKSKKEKKPSVEDKPFPEFMQQDYLPALEKALTKRNVQDLQLAFDKDLVTGSWANGQRQFVVYFPKEELKGIKAFSCASGGLKASEIEPFLIDERQITLDLLVFGVVQRLEAQKWLGSN